MRKKVVFLGDSITMGMVSANYVKMVEERIDRQKFLFFNAGINNDLVINLLRRLPPLALLQPDVVIIMAGTNDVIGSLSAHSGLFMIMRKWIFHWPSIAWSLGIMRKLIRIIRTHSKARVAVASIPVLGENLNSIPMARVRAYNMGLAEIVREEKADYIPVFERQEAWLKENQKDAGHTFITSLDLSFEWIFRHAFYKETLDEFSKRKGFQLLNDSVHMNSQGAALIAGEMENYLNSLEE